jgi:hypothetical protein
VCNNGIFKALGNSSGASIIVVLAVMLFLFALGVSALNAAGGSHGTGLSQFSHNRLTIYADSIQRTIMYSMQEMEEFPPGSDFFRITSPASLGFQVMGAVSDHLYVNRNNPNPTEPLTFSLTLGFDGTEMDIPSVIHAVGVVDDENDAAYVSFIIVTGEGDDAFAHRMVFRLHGIEFETDVTNGDIIGIVNAERWGLVALERVPWP